MTPDAAARIFTELREDRPGRFDETAAAVLAFQAARNPVYGRYCKSLGLKPHPSTGPYLPVEAFKHAPVTTFPPEEAERVFESSGTGRGVPGRHYVRDLSVYERAVAAHFESVFGEGPFLIIAHLPRYEQQGASSSLLYMVEHLVARFGAEGSGYFLHDPTILREASHRSRDASVPLVIFGAAFGLLDLVKREVFRLPADALVVETGGMKTYRREVERSDLHERLAEGFGLARARIRSEYGMCELTSQCYTRGDAVFYPPPWMRVTVFDPEDPFREQPPDTPGALAAMDLGNVYSASALLTQDLAVRRGRGFEVLGRLTGAELRGCNFLLEHV